MSTTQIRSIACGVALLLAVSTGNARAEQRVPSDDELHSMYCVEVLRADIALQQHLVDASSEAAGAASQPEQRAQWIDTSAELLQKLAKLEGTLHDLQSYMLPRIPAIDSLALASAIRQADADVEEADRCAGECAEPTRTDYQKPQARTAAWSSAALLVRVRGCENPSWLPH
jgi:hypothetical protein